MDEFQKELIAVFREEVAESLDELAQLVGGLPALEGGATRRAVAAAFRAAHNVKGAARTVGFETFEQLAHVIEDALAPFREGDARPEAALCEAILRGVTLLERIAGGEEASGEAEAACREIAAGGAGPAPHAREQAAGLAGREAGEDSGGRPDPASEAPAPNAATTVRVDVGRLDGVMAHVGELLVSHARQAERASRLASLQASFREVERSLPDGIRQSLAGFTRQLERLCDGDRRELTQFGYLTDEISGSMKRLRMLPLANLAAQWRRIVREAAQDAGRRVRVEVRVGEVEVDKHVLDALRDPIMHLLRNAVAHGIEAPQERERRGKNPEGAISVRASMRGSMVELVVSDDGRGLELDAIGRRAVEFGVVGQEQLARMDERGIAALVFEPGLSTASGVDRLSGRGVGLDVVVQRLRGLGGHVEIAPQAGGAPGTSFRLTVPVSLVSSRNLLVRCADLTCAVPIELVERTLRVRTAEIRQVNGASAVQLHDGEPLRVRWLSSLMGRPRGADPEQVTIVVVRRGAHTVGVVVDEILGVEDHVIKPLPWNLKSVPGAGGAIILGNGSLAIVVEVGRVFEAGQSAGGEAADSVRMAQERRRQRILVVDDSLTSRTLERNILSAVGFDVTVASDGAEAWDVLQGAAFDLVISDIEMPKMNGFELTRRIRQQEGLRQLPVILVTSLDSPSDRAAGAEAGADEYIVKGQFEQRQLLEAIERLL